MTLWLKDRYNITASPDYNLLIDLTVLAIAIPEFIEPYYAIHETKNILRARNLGLTALFSQME